MIYRDSTDSYRIETIGGEITKEFTQAELLAHLRACGVWSEDNLQQLVAMEVGSHTIKPFAKV